MAKIPDMPSGEHCFMKFCSALATTYRLTNELVLTRTGIFEGVLWVCNRHREQDST